MGKGLIPDSNPLCVAAARSTALGQADVVLVIGARLNWLLHYGQGRKWNKHVKFIRVDLQAETVHDNRHSDVALVGDAATIVDQLASFVETEQQISSSSSSPLLKKNEVSNMLPSHTEWHKLLLAKCHENTQNLLQKFLVMPSRKSAVPKPLTYHQAFSAIRNVLPHDYIFISEGANTMDIARSMFDVQQPRSRLDAGTHATMGVGMGYGIASALHQQLTLGRHASPRPIVAIVGDSAFGFSGMEIETAVRNKLGMLIIVMNNGGVSSHGHGLLIGDVGDWTDSFCFAPGVQGSSLRSLPWHTNSIITTDRASSRDQVRPIVQRPRWGRIRRQDGA